jgi:hypothetical protein
VSEVDDLRRRLALAERVCALVGITAATGETDRDKAKTQAWMDWNHEYGRLSPRLTDDEILQLAARRDIIRNNTLVRLRRKTVDSLDKECRGTLLEALYESQHEPDMHAAHLWGEWRANPEFPEFQQRDCGGHCNRVQTRRTA